jgi:2-phospho-L-lactate guanylyltransferase (CobY/MobA/RfbA family)
MQAIINVELDEKCGPGMSAATRLELVLATVRLVFTRAIGDIRVVDYVGPDGPVTENTAVITFEHASDKNAVLAAMYKVAYKFNQDCIAILFSDGEGRLVGPEADRWGGFKIEYFKRPAMYELLKEAA